MTKRIVLNVRAVVVVIIVIDDDGCSVVTVNITIVINIYCFWYYCWYHWSSFTGFLVSGMSGLVIEFFL